MKKENELINDIKEQFSSLMNARSLAVSNDKRILEFLLENSNFKAEYKERFFEEQCGALIFKKDDFLNFLDLKLLSASYTSFSNKIGLGTSEKRFLKNNENVVLNFPFKDGVIKGGQSRDDDKSTELFFNNILAKSEIDVLFAPKVLNNFELLGEGDIKEVLKNNPSLLIKGNNLIALHTLKEYFKNSPQEDKIKLIYIDPPYNTGNDSFNYNDKFNHSTWLTFMKNRLEIARELLRDDGVIFVQCDDNEQAYLKVLMDEIFGRENFVGCVAWRRTDNQPNIGYFARVKDYILIFSKSKINLKFNKMPLTEKAKKEYRYQDEKGYFRRAILLDKTRGRHFYKKVTKLGNILEGPWMVTEQKFDEMNTNNEIYWTEKGDGQPYGKIYLDNAKGQIVNDFWDIEVGTNQGASLDLEKTFGERVFAFPKPEALLQRIIEISTQENDLVLDFFVGSGTTMAVAHKMKRRYIGIEQMDYIQNITKERMKKVIEGEQGGISKAVSWSGGGNVVYCELASLNAKFIEQIENCSNENELDNIYEALRKLAFIDYRADIQSDFKDLEFGALSFEEKKRILKKCLDRNMDYIPYADIEDSEYKIDEQTRILNKIFYKKS
ncbi:site-specific DNA-methyltransferase [Campylobacter coli]|nr:site-specific DNA-methyltransferase [Campylobacter coli]EDO8925000.1 site-specific DNA-methyltransferase [Campylobacter coli]